MFIFGHIGLTVGAVRAVDRETDLRLPILLSLLPDLVDKPIAVLLPSLVNHNTRNFGHTLLGAAVVLAVLIALRRRAGKTMLLWFCYLGHFVLDRMWLTDGPTILFWPLLGQFPRLQPHHVRTPHLLAYNLAGELAGLSIILALAWRHRLFQQERWEVFVETGRLLPADGLLDA